MFIAPLTKTGASSGTKWAPASPTPRHPSDTGLRPANSTARSRRSKVYARAAHLRLGSTNSGPLGSASLHLS